MKKNQIHPAAIRSKELIASNLIDLMKMNSYNKISVKEITEEAELTRRTFYAHFKTKEDVLNYVLGKYNRTLLDQIVDLLDREPKVLALTYFSFWMEEIEFLRLMKEHNLLPLLFENFDQNIREIREIFGCNLSERDQQYVAYSSAYFTGILSSLLNRWIDEGANESPEEMVDILTLLTGKFSGSFLK